MACEINASPSNGLVQSADGSGIIKLKSDGKTTNALAWVNFNGTGTVAIRSSYNVSSITDNGTGDYTVNFATALSDANYSALVSGLSFTSTDLRRGASISGDSTTGATLMSTTQLKVITGNPATGTLSDIALVNVAVFGN
jgi:hypothetical protein